jgi:hypothetical protein
LDEGTFEYLESLEAEKKIIEELNAKLREKQELAKTSLVIQKNSVIELDSKIEFADDGRITNSAKILLGL